MAYPNYYYPVGYQPYMPNTQQQIQQQFQQMQAQNQPQTTGFIRVPSEDVARNWNVMPGASATFINENAPYCYTKTVGASQLEGYQFKKYRLVEEDDAPQPRQAPVGNANSGVCTDMDKSDYALKSELNALQGHVNKLEQAVHKLELGGVKNESVDEQANSSSAK